MLKYAHLVEDGEDIESLTTILRTTKPPKRGRKRGRPPKRRLVKPSVKKRLHAPTHGASELDGPAFKAKVTECGMSLEQFARLIGRNGFTVTRYASAQKGEIPGVIDLVFELIEAKPEVSLRYRGRTGPGSGLSEEQKTKALERLAKGESPVQIAKTFGVHRTTVFRLQKKHDGE
jgi:hypothetical protein